MGLRRLSAASLVASSLAVASSAHALSVSPTDDAQALADAIVGSGSSITITSTSYVGAAAASGLYTDGPLGIADGALLTSGAAINALPPDDSDATGTGNNLPGHPLCNALVGGFGSLDATLLTITFDLAPQFDGIQLSSVFGSEEYPGPGIEFNDAYGVYLNGQQIVLDEDGQPITISGGALVVLPPANGTEYDATTGIINTRAPLAGGSTGNVLQIVICDVGDDVLDSGAFIAGLNGCVGSDCSGTVPCELIDNDGDGVSSCDDCDDGDAGTYPGAIELCDGVDNDCDEYIDEGVMCPEETCITIRRGEEGDAQDATVYPHSPGYNDDTQVMWTGELNPPGVIKVSLVQFDLCPIPPGAQVVSANLEVYQLWTPATVPNKYVHISPVMDEWCEDDVTWNDIKDGLTWTAFTSFHTVNNGDAVHSSDVTALAQAWYADPASNHGVSLWEDVPWSSPSSPHAFNASEHATLERRPALHVCYLPPAIQ